MHTSQKVRLEELISQDKQAEKITDMKNERYITLSSYGKGAHERIIKDGKYPVPFLGYRVSAGQFIYSRIDARNGAYGLVGPELDGFVVSKDFPIYDINTQRVIPRFLLWAVLGNGFIQQVKQSSFGATNRMRIKEEILESYTINLPDFAKQEEIVNSLDGLQQIINKRRRELELYDDLVKARFVEMFSAGFPEGTLLNLCNIIDYRGKTPEKVEMGLPFITAKNIKMHYMSMEPRDYISKETYDKVMVRGFPKEGDVVFTTEAPLGNVCRIPHFDTEFYIGQRIVTLQTEKIVPTYLEYALTTEEFKRKYMGKSSGSTVTGIRVRLLEQLTIPVPPMDLQKEFEAFVVQVDKSKVAVQKALDEAQLLFNSLMQKYFG